MSDYVSGHVTCLLSAASDVDVVGPPPLGDPPPPREPPRVWCLIDTPATYQTRHCELSSVSEYSWVGLPRIVIGSLVTPPAFNSLASRLRVLSLPKGDFSEIPLGVALPSLLGSQPSKTATIFFSFCDVLFLFLLFSR